MFLPTIPVGFRFFAYLALQKTASIMYYHAALRL